MTEQLALAGAPRPAPKLTVRQQRALDHVQARGAAGIHADELGALMHADHHPPDARCDYCGTTGNELLRTLRRKGLVRYRRGRDALAGYWQAVGAATTSELQPPGMLRDDEALPF